MDGAGIYGVVQMVKCAPLDFIRNMLDFTGFILLGILCYFLSKYLIENEKKGGGNV